MRFILVAAMLVMASCATPRTAPEVQVEGVYLLGNPVIAEDGTFASRASVHDFGDLDKARKAAWMRMLSAAQTAGYSHFTIGAEETGRILLYRLTITGKLYRNAASGGNVYPVAAMERLARGLPAEEPKPVYTPVRSASSAAQATVQRAVALAGRSASESTIEAISNPATPVLDPTGVPVGVEPASINPCANKPAGEAEACAAESGEPLVIMAPQDITGSVKRGVDSSPARNAASSMAAGGAQPGSSQGGHRLPNGGSALSSIPTGVIYRSR